MNVSELLAAGEEALAEAGFLTGDFAEARRLFETAQDLAGSTADAAGRAQAAAGLGMVAHYQNITLVMGGTELSSDDIEDEEKLFRSALAGYEQAGADTAGARALFGLGLVFQVLRQDWTTAMPYFWEALGLVSAPGSGADLYLRSEVHRHVGFYFLVEDVQPAEAVRHLQISLDLREELGDPRRLPSALSVLGEAELAAGNSEQALGLLRRAVEIAREAKLMPARIEQAERALREAAAASAGSAEPDADAAPPGDQPTGDQPAGG